MIEYFNNQDSIKRAKKLKETHKFLYLAQTLLCSSFLEIETFHLQGRPLKIEGKQLKIALESS